MGKLRKMGKVLSWQLVADWTTVKPQEYYEVNIINEGSPPSAHFPGIYQLPLPNNDGSIAALTYVCLL